MPADPARFPLYPLFADLRGRRVLVVGGGMVAHRKVEALLEAGARVRVVAPVLGSALATRAAEGRIAHLAERFSAQQLDDAWLAIAATGDRAVNRAVAEAGDARRVGVNGGDDSANGRFEGPARVARGPLPVAMSGGGGTTHGAER